MSNIPENAPISNDTIPADSVVQKTVVVEDSVTHQAGDGITANMSPSLETPDIFDNSAQAVVKQQTVVLDEDIPKETAVQASELPAQVIDEQVQRITPAISANLQQVIEGENSLAPNLATLSDGSVDIPRDGH